MSDEEQQPPKRLKLNPTSSQDSDVQIIETKPSQTSQSASITDPDVDAPLSESDDEVQVLTMETRRKTRELLYLRLNESVLLPLYLYNRPKDLESHWMNDVKKQQVIAALQSVIPLAIAREATLKEKEKGMAWVQRAPNFTLSYKIITQSSEYALIPSSNNVNQLYTLSNISKFALHLLVTPPQVNLTSTESCSAAFGFDYHQNAFEPPATKKGTLDKFLQRIGSG